MALVSPSRCPSDRNGLVWSGVVVVVGFERQFERRCRAELGDSTWKEAFEASSSEIQPPRPASCVTCGIQILTMVEYGCLAGGRGLKSEKPDPENA